MKILISTNNNSDTAVLDSRFGRCPYFYIIDTLTNEKSFVKNQGSLASGGAGIKAAEQVINEKIDILITGSLGPNAFKLIKKASIIAFKSNEDSIQTVINNFNENKLEKINIEGLSRK